LPRSEERCILSVTGFRVWVVVLRLMTLAACTPQRVQPVTPPTAVDVRAGAFQAVCGDS